MQRNLFQIVKAAKTLLDPRRHLFVSFTANQLELVLFVRSYFGWKEEASRSIAVEKKGEKYSLIGSYVSAAVESMKLPSQTRVSWVLPPDIVGILPRNSFDGNDVNLEKSLPFQREHVVVSTRSVGNAFKNQILWVHKDWLSEFCKISSAAGLQCVELFARAQLFTAAVPEIAGQGAILVENTQGTNFLHVFNAQKEIIRSTNLGKCSDDRLITLIGREKNSIGNPASRVYRTGLDQTEPAFQTDELHSIDVLVTSPEKLKVRELAFSIQQGVELEPGESEVIPIVMWVTSLVLSIVIALLAVLWLEIIDLKEQISDGRAAIRKDLKVFEEAKLLRKESLRSAKLVELRDGFEAEPQSFKALASVIGTIDAKSTLSYFSQKDHAVVFAGTGTGRLDFSSLQNPKYLIDFQPTPVSSIKEVTKVGYAYKARLERDLSTVEKFSERATKP